LWIRRTKRPGLYSYVVLDSGSSGRACTPPHCAHGFISSGTGYSTSSASIAAFLASARSRRLRAISSRRRHRSVHRKRDVVVAIASVVGDDRPFVHLTRRSVEEAEAGVAPGVHGFGDDDRLAVAHVGHVFDLDGQILETEAGDRACVHDSEQFVCRIGHVEA
jgi:hypothetical protein